MRTDTRFRSRAAQGHAVFVRRRSLEAWLTGLSIALPILVAAIGAGMLLRYQPVGGWIVPLLGLGALTFGALAAVRYLRARTESYAQFLRGLEGRLRLTGNELVNADELERALPTVQDPLSRGLAQQVIERGAQELGRIEFARLAPAISLRSPLWRAAGSIALAAALFVISPDGFRSSSARLVRPGLTELPPALQIRVSPGDATVQRGSTVQVTAVLPETVPEAKLYYRTPGGAWRALEMEGEGGGVATSFRGQLAEVGENTEYAVASGEARSEVYRLQVIDPLRAVGYQKRIEAPAYTRIAPEQELAADGHFSAIAGSRLSLGIETSIAGATGRLAFEDGSELPLERMPDGRLSAAFPLRRSQSYTVELSAAEVGGSWTSDPFRLEAVPDRAPTLYQLAPERSIEMPPEMEVVLEADCLDDFGLTRLDLVYVRNTDPPLRVNLARWQGTREARASQPWALEAILRSPGDVVRYHLELVDNDPITGPKSTSGPECEIRFPSLEQMFDAVSNERDEQKQSVTEMLQEQKDLRKDLEKARMELKQNKQLGWQEQEQLKDLSQRQEKVADQIDKLAESLDRSMAQMQQTNTFSPEMLQKVQEIGELVRQISDGEFKKQMERLQEAMQKLDKSAIEKALQDLAFNQEQLEKNLDRTLELLKQLVAEEKLDQLIQQAEKLLAEQKEINQQLQGDRQAPADSSGQKPDSAENQDQKSESGEPKDGQKGEPKAGEKKEESSLSKEQAEALQKKQEELAKELAKLQQEMDKLRQEEEKRLKELQATQQQKPEQQLAQAQQNMKQAQQSMSACNKSGSLKFGRQAEQKLDQFKQEMRQAQQQAQKKQNDEVVKRLFALSSQLVNLSKAQESLLATAPSQSTRDLAAEQSRLADGAKRTLDELYEVARMSRMLSPELGRMMGEAVRQLESATGALEEGDRSGANLSGRSSANALNQTVLALLNASSQQQNASSSGSCSNPMASMRGLSGQQQSLNQDMQQMMAGQQQGRMSQTGTSGEALAQMAARQEMIRRGLQEVQEALGNRGDVLGRLGELGEEMEDIAQEMRANRVDERVLRRQEKILSRLLTAQRSLRKEDYKDERISRTGQNPDDLVSPEQVRLDLTRQDLLRRGILRGAQDPVPTDYRQLVEQYFRSLSEKP